MSQKIIIACATVALALSACAKKDSYISAKGGQASFIKEDVSTKTVEQRATDVLEQDTQYTAIRQNEQSQDLRESIVSVQVESTTIESPTGQLEAFKITFLDRNCQEQEKVISVQEKALLMSEEGLGISNFPGVQGVLRLNCLDEICEGLLVRIQQTSNVAGQGMPSNVPQAEASLVLGRNENGLFQPLLTKNNQFIQARNLEDARVSCLAGDESSTSSLATESAYELQNPKVRAALGVVAASPSVPTTPITIPVHKTRADEDQLSAIQRRNTQLAQLDQQIAVIENSLTPNFVSTAQGQADLQRLTALKAQRASLQGTVQTQTMTAVGEAYNDLTSPKMRDAIRANTVTPVEVPFTN